MAVTDAAYVCPALLLDVAMPRGVPTYAYRFDDRTGPQPHLPRVSFPHAAFHGAEVQYLFDAPTAPIRTVFGPQ
jgi:para-nitrobenzyl esterase